MSAKLIELPVAAQRLGKSCAATWNLIVQGQVRGEKVGRGWFVDANDVDRVRTENAANATAGEPSAA